MFGGVGVGGLSRKWRRSGSLARILVTGGRRERELSSIKLKTSNCNNQIISFLPLGHGREGGVEKEVGESCLQS